jgi:hypothetical protein
VSDKVRVHSLPINGLEIAMEAVCKVVYLFVSLSLKDTITALLIFHKGLGKDGFFGAKIQFPQL